jgi:hypothetical protein
VHYVEHFSGEDGKAFTASAASMTKRRNSTYLEADHERAWVKIRNRDYTGAVDTHELFEPHQPKQHYPHFHCGGYRDGNSRAKLPDMTEYVQVLIVANLFRLFALVTALIFAYLGYRLYVQGVFEKAQEVKAAFGAAHLTLRQVAPGVVFGIAAVVIAILGVVRPIVIDRVQSYSATVQEAGLEPSNSLKVMEAAQDPSPDPVPAGKKGKLPSLKSVLDKLKNRDELTPEDRLLIQRQLQKEQLRRLYSSAKKKNID